MTDDPVKAAAARARFSLHPVQTDADFDLAYGLLEQQFAAAGELEPREELLEWLRVGLRTIGEWRIRYHLLLARDGGQVAGVRDCYCAVHGPSGRVVVLLSHLLVRTPWRRSGLAALMRTLPVDLARAEGDGEIVLVAEMEYYDPDVLDTAVRLVAYGRGGFRVVPPELVRYEQPDFADPPLAPVPLLLLVRVLGAQDAVLAPEQARAILSGLEAIHEEPHTRAHLPDGPLWLLPAPEDVNDEARLAALHRRRIPELYD